MTEVASGLGRDRGARGVAALVALGGKRLPVAFPLTTEQQRILSSSTSQASTRAKYSRGSHFTTRGTSATQDPNALGLRTSNRTWAPSS